MGIFIQITLDNRRITPEIANKIVRLCPVEIFTLKDKSLSVRPDREDECTLCELCLDLAPPKALVISKTYKDEPLVSRGRDY